jgi:type II secretory pathway component GspD/PulD (secretin)
MMMGNTRIATLLLAGFLTTGAVAPAVAAEREPDAATTCRKLPAGKRVVKLNLKPGTEIPDLVAWISSITCKPFILPSGIASGKTVTVVSPQLITVGEAYHLFLEALDSVGLTAYSDGRFMRIIETSRAKNSPIPVITTVP